MPAKLVVPHIVALILSIYIIHLVEKVGGDPNVDVHAQIVSCDAAHASVVH